MKDRAPDLAKMRALHLRSSQNRWWNDVPSAVSVAVQHRPQSSEKFDQMKVWDGSNVTSQTQISLAADRIWSPDNLKTTSPHEFSHGGPKPAIFRSSNLPVLLPLVAFRRSQPTEILDDAGLARSLSELNWMAGFVMCGTNRNHRRSLDTSPLAIRGFFVLVEAVFAGKNGRGSFMGGRLGLGFAERWNIGGLAWGLRKAQRPESSSSLASTIQCGENKSSQRRSGPGPCEGRVVTISAGAGKRCVRRCTIHGSWISRPRQQRLSQYPGLRISAPPRSP